MPLDIERAGARDFDHVSTPDPLGAVKLDVTTAPAEPLPFRERQVLHTAHTNTAIEWHPLGFPEGVVGHRLTQEFAAACVFAGLGLVPMDLIGRAVHDGFLAAVVRRLSSSVHHYRAN